MLIPWLYFLKDNEQVLVESPTQRQVFNGPRIYVGMPLQRVTRRLALVMGPLDYLQIRDILSGKLKTVKGPGQYFLAATEEIHAFVRMIPLQRNEYVRIMDQLTGQLRVEKGEQSVWLLPTEKLLGEVTPGIHVDADTAVMVRNLTTGSLELISQPQVFIPEPTQEVVEICPRIQLEDHECVVIKQADGSYEFRDGHSVERAFFLPPYCQLLHFRWSTGIHKENRDLHLTHLDLRPKFMWYEFDVRTQDNVELVVGITFFWQIVDVRRMVNTTDDAPGDICSHARSLIIQAVSKVSLEAFLAGLNAIVHGAVIAGEQPFYTERGLFIHAVEVRSVSCKDAETQRILQDIIQETTNRINLLQQQASQNEVRLKQIEGDLVAEHQQAELLKVQALNGQQQARMAGEAEALKVQTFFQALATDLSLETRLAIYQTLRKQDALAAVSQGQAQLYFTPADVDLSIESRQPRG